jgi:hypothetical protein
VGSGSFVGFGSGSVVGVGAAVSLGSTSAGGAVVGPVVGVGSGSWTAGPAWLELESGSSDDVLDGRPQPTAYPMATRRAAITTVMPRRRAINMGSSGLCEWMTPR